MTAEIAIAADPAVIDQAANPGEFVIQACQRATTLLRQALDRGDTGLIAELRSQAEAVRVYTVQKQLGTDAQLAAGEIVSRADRGLGLAIRRGQAAGEITKKGDHQGNQHTIGRVDNVDSSKSAPSDFAPRVELYGGGGKPGIYDLTDGVPEKEFEDALAQAKAEGDVSRPNVVRKIRQRRAPASPGDGEQVPEPADRSSQAAARRVELIRRWAGEGSTSRQIAGLLGIRDDIVRRIAREHQISIRADEVVGRTRRLDSNRIVRETANALEALATGARLVSPAELDKSQSPGWASSMATSLRELNRLVKTLKEEMTDDR
jgi:hypothetical protein